MANVDNPHGLAYLGRTEDGGFAKVRHFAKDASEGGAIYPGDVVIRENDGNIKAGGTPGTSLYTGVAQNWGALSTLTDHAVITSPSALFEAQDNNASDGFAAGDLGMNANLEFNSGNATTKKSGHEINETGADGTTATLDVQLLDLLRVSNNAFGAWSRIIVKFNKHRMSYGVAGV
jgi:hypothetical protein